MPVAIEIGADLLLLCALLVLIGLSKGLQYSIIAFLRWLGQRIKGLHIPFTHIGIPGAGAIGGALEDAANWMYNQLAAGILAFERTGVWLWHNLAELAVLLGEQIKGLAYDVLWLYHHVERFTVPYWIGRLQRWIVAQLRAFAQHPIRYLRHALTKVEHIALDVPRIARAAVGAIAETPPWVGRRIGALEREVDALERDVPAWWRKAALLALAGGVALHVLERVAPWVRCRNVNRVGRALCGMPGHLLDDFLGLVTDFAVLVNICQVIPWLEAAFTVTAAPLIGVLARAGAGLCGAGVSKPPALAVPPLNLPPVQATTLQLP